MLYRIFCHKRSDEEPNEKAFFSDMCHDYAEERLSMI
jgi:hypothetical protein